MMIRSSNSDNPAVSIDSEEEKIIFLCSVAVLKSYAHDPKKRKGAIWSLQRKPILFSNLRQSLLILLDGQQQQGSYRVEHYSLAEQ